MGYGLMLEAKQTDGFDHSRYKGKHPSDQTPVAASQARDPISR